MEWIKEAVFATLRRGATLPGRKSLERFTWLVILRDTLRRLQIDCVLDVGANQGQFGRDLRRVGYKGWIVSFEPSPADFAMLRSCTDSKWLSHQTALAQDNGERLLNLGPTRLSVLNSFLPPVEGSVDKTVPVITRRLDGLMDEIVAATNAKRLFLKIDTQGFDLEVVKGAGARIGEFLAIISEVSITPIYRGMPHYLDALRLYESLGFDLHSLHVVSRNTDDSIVEYDAILLRRGS